MPQKFKPSKINTHTVDNKSYSVGLNYLGKSGPHIFLVDRYSSDIRPDYLNP